MAWVVAIHRKPKDPDAYDRYYFETHLPLAKALPGLRRYELSKGPVSSAEGASDVHLVALLKFDNLAAIEQAVASPQGLAASADARLLAHQGAGIEILVFEDREI